ncbi:MAG: hypothetical protein HY814_04465 [Candidatus Riflebacteria bacterium]|nr:hypothetical protein [Candidatus Riflebacteria bacterium]
MKLEQLRELVEELLAQGLEIETGKRKFLLAPPEHLAKARSAKSQPIVLRAVKLARFGSRANRFQPVDFKVEPPKILFALKDAPTGLRMQDLAERLDVKWQGLIASLRFLKRSKKIREANGLYFLMPKVKPAVEQARFEKAKLAAAKGAKGCRIAGCKRDHYAKGLCNNHYNIERRRVTSSEEFDPEAEVERRKAYRITILDALKEQRDGITLFNLGQVVNEKWQTLRQPANELVAENLVVKKGKLYLPAGPEDEARSGE